MQIKLVIIKDIIIKKAITSHVQIKYTNIVFFNI